MYSEIVWVTVHCYYFILLNLIIKTSLYSMIFYYSTEHLSQKIKENLLPHDVTPINSLSLVALCGRCIYQNMYLVSEMIR